MPLPPSNPAPATRARRNGAASPRRSNGEATYRRVLDAAVASILEKGYYKSSSNEIARRAGVTWGVIQHQFGTREALLLEVLNDRWRRLQELVGSADVTGTTLEERLRRVVEVLEEHYGSAEHLAQIQILLDLSHNPDSSTETRRAVAEHGRKLGRAWQPLFHEALGDAADEQDLVLYAFTTLRGYLTGNLIARSITRPQNNRAQKEMLVAGVASVIRTEAARRGIVLG
jgi:AcrR family transcriptional regulator